MLFRHREIEEDTLLPFHQIKGIHWTAYLASLFFPGDLDSTMLSAKMLKVELSVAITDWNSEVLCQYVWQDNTVVHGYSVEEIENTAVITLQFTPLEAGTVNCSITM